MKETKSIKKEDNKMARSKSSRLPQLVVGMILVIALIMMVLYLANANGKRLSEAKQYCTSQLDKRDTYINDHATVDDSTSKLAGLSDDQVTNPDTVKQLSDKLNKLKQLKSARFDCNTGGVAEVNRVSSDIITNTADMRDAMDAIPSLADQVKQSRNDKLKEAAKASFDKTVDEAKGLLDKVSSKIPANMKSDFSSLLDSIKEKAKNFDSAEAYDSAKTTIQGWIDKIKVFVSN